MWFWLRAGLAPANAGQRTRRGRPSQAAAAQDQDLAQLQAIGKNNILVLVGQDHWFALWVWGFLDRRVWLCFELDASLSTHQYSLAKHLATLGGEDSIQPSKGLVLGLVQNLHNSASPAP